MPLTWKQAVRKTSALLAPQRPAPSNEELTKIPVPAARLLVDLIEFVDKHCGSEESLYRTKGIASEVEDLYLTFHRHLTTSTTSFHDLHMYSPHAITSTIKKILRRYQPLLSYSVSQALIDQTKVTLDSIAAEFVKIRATNRDVLRVLLCHWKRISDAKHMRMDVSLLAQNVGLLVVRPSEDIHSLNQRAILKTRQKIARKLIRGAVAWPYDASTDLPLPEIPSDLTAADVQYAMKLVWSPKDGITYDEDRLRAQLTPHGSINSIAVHPTQPKARVSMQLKKAATLDKVVVKLQKKAHLHVVHVQVLSNKPVHPDETPSATTNLASDDSPADEDDKFMQKTHRPSWMRREPVVLEDVESDADPAPSTDNSGVVQPPAEAAVAEMAPAVLPDTLDATNITQDDETTAPASHHVDDDETKDEDVVQLQVVQDVVPDVTLASFGTQTSLIPHSDVEIQSAPECCEGSSQTDATSEDGEIAKVIARVRRVIEVLQTTTMSVADCSSNPTICAMHQAQVQVLRMLESIVGSAAAGAATDPTACTDDVVMLEYRSAIDAHLQSKTKVLEAEVMASHELLRMHKAQSAQQMDAWQIETTSLRMIALEAEKQSMELRQDLRTARSELACHLATLSHLKQEKGVLQEKLLVAETKAQSLERDTTQQKAELLDMKDVATKAQLRVEAYKANAPSFQGGAEWNGLANQAVATPEDGKSPPTSAVDVLANLKDEMSRRLQSQIDYTKATIDAMQKQDPASAHLTEQQRALSHLVTSFVGDTTRTDASHHAMDVSRQKLKELSDAMSFTRAERTAPNPQHPPQRARPCAAQPLTTGTTQPWIAQWMSHVDAQVAPPRLSKTNPDSLNAARLSLSNYHHVVGQRSIYNA